MTRTIICGGVAGGATAATRLRRLDEKMEIIIIERGEHISFATCGLPYYVGGIIKDRERLFQETPQGMKRDFNVEARIFSEITEVFPEKRAVRISSRERGSYEEHYDFLLLAPGAFPATPPIPGIDHENVLTLRDVTDADRIIATVKGKTAKTVTIIGAGFIGVEMAENLRHLGLDVTLIEAAPHILPPFDQEIAVLLENELKGNGIRLFLNSRIARFSGNSHGLDIELADAAKVRTDLVILSAGIKPATAFLKKSGLKMSQDGHIQVNERMETSLPAVYAVGDAVEVRNMVTGQPFSLPLAGPANRQARVAADNIAGGNSIYKGALGSAILKVFSVTGAVTGANERLLRQNGLDYKSVIIHPFSHAGYYPGAAQMSLKVLFNERGKILGAQAAGSDGVDKCIDIVATAMMMNGTIYDLSDLELCYAPPFSSARDPVNTAGYVAENLLAGYVTPISYEQFLAFAPRTTTLLDVRSAKEFSESHLPDALSIPLEELRHRLAEIDPGKPVVIYCAVGKRAYLGARILKQSGFEVYTLNGGYKTVAGIK